MEVKPLPSSFINSAKVNMRTKLYEQGICNQNTPSFIAKYGEDSGETRWIWYSKEQIEEWCDEMRSHESSGIRIYLGQKEEPIENDSEAEEYEPKPGQLCLMIVLTKQNENNPERHDNIVYEQLPDFEARKQKTDSLKYMNFNAGSYSPPLKLRFDNDYPNDSLS